MFKASSEIAYFLTANDCTGFLAEVQKGAYRGLNVWIGCSKPIPDLCSAASQFFDCGACSDNPSAPREAIILEYQCAESFNVRFSVGKSTKIIPKRCV